MRPPTLLILTLAVVLALGTTACRDSLTDHFTAPTGSYPALDSLGGKGGEARLLASMDNEPPSCHFSVDDDDEVDAYNGFVYENPSIELPVEEDRGQIVDMWDGNPAREMPDSIGWTCNFSPGSIYVRVVPHPEGEEDVNEFVMLWLPSAPEEVEPETFAWFLVYLGLPAEDDSDDRIPWKKFVMLELVERITNTEETVHDSAPVTVTRCRSAALKSLCIQLLTENGE